MVLPGVGLLRVEAGGERLYDKKSKFNEEKGERVLITEEPTQQNMVAFNAFLLKSLQCWSAV